MSLHTSKVPDADKKAHQDFIERSLRPRGQALQIARHAREAQSRSAHTGDILGCVVHSCREDLRDSDDCDQ